MTTKEKIQVMQAFTEGEIIQVSSRNLDIWSDLPSCEEPLWDWDGCKYRIKPEPKVRPYTFKEMCEAVKKHGVLIKTKEANEVMTICEFDESGVYYYGCSLEGYEDFMTSSVWFDDNTPCGIVEE